MDLKEIMDLDDSVELRNRTWWWWFWLFFFRPENGKQWKQLMILWGTRNCRRLKVNDMVWDHSYVLKRGEREFEVPGITAAWFYDGERMIDPFFLKSGTLHSEWGEDTASLTLKNDGHCSFSSKNGDFGVSAQFKDVEVNMDITEWKPGLYELVHTGRRYMSSLGYKMVKLRACSAKGTLKVGSDVHNVEGTTYFQKVRINSPTSPWYFGTFHGAKGDYIDYFMPHIGPPMFRRSPGHTSRLDFGERMLSKGIHFVEADGKSHTIKDISIEKTYMGDLPVFRLKGQDDGKRIEMEMRTYSRAYWRVEQPFLGLFKTILYYNEYPAYLSNFRFEDGGRIKTLDDMGYTIGNCEHSWGIV